MDGIVTSEEASNYLESHGVTHLANSGVLNFHANDTISFNFNFDVANDLHILIGDNIKVIDLG